jgi:dipeptidyl aminopeptidase/acylaminoacyl peptidase
VPASVQAGVGTGVSVGTVVGGGVAVGGSAVAASVAGGTKAPPGVAAPRQAVRHIHSASKARRGRVRMVVTAYTSTIRPNHRTQGPPMPTDIHEHRFDTGQVVLNYAETPGPGTPLVLLHGGSARWQSFESIWADLAAGHHLYAPDLRGHGRSAWATGTYRLRDYADDIVRFLQSVVARPALVFGHSLGGMAALMAAAQYPGGVRAVAVGDAPLSAQTWHDDFAQNRLQLIDQANINELAHGGAGWILGGWTTFPPTRRSPVWCSSVRGLSGLVCGP